MSRWPSLRTVFLVWGALAGVAFIAYLGILRAAPPDELKMASDLSFQVLLAAVVVGIPSIIFLFLFLLIGAI
jgi:hypothetical protein